MSSGALFGNTAARGNVKTLVELKAGKMTMKGKMVYPDNRKGQLYAFQSEDGLMHLCWKDRTTGQIEDDLIIFPDDCEFKHVSQCKTGRVYLLRFKSSSRKFFFWLQDLKTDKDEEQCRKINEVLNNPPTPSLRSSGANPEGDLHHFLNNMSQQQLMQLFGGVGQISGLGSLLGTMNRPLGSSRMTSSTTPATTTVSRPPASQTPAPATTTVNETPKSSNTAKPVSRTVEPSAPVAPATENPIRLSDLQNFLSSMPTPPGMEPVVLSGQAGPVVQQFGVGQEVVNAASSGNIEEFVNALESDVQRQDQVAEAGTPPQSQEQAPSQAQPQAEEKSSSTSAEAGSTKKDGDDDDDMAMCP